ncbi:CRISPR-associated helicase Cas3' [Heliophilum fasciatum]|uniref:CRISPR-associated Cas3 family helicase n=1 Tax=Heliophilum fasciatum TaxID=35700 RepID=A0A4R2RHZ9_9FIRM|nr:CRISPR-associated helicase Cas3' [Heliophilum fasciatum]MCW2278646.1 CRISPR-associated endonuclease/helicase Cas3 [Heliophilum fasciatum]TCP62633.1 CRISPR-associated Cas3 family helicase [Heliophilum fasciatum]
MEYWAHSSESSDRRHLLTDHAREVAMMAKEFADKFGNGDAAYWLGLWHDLGKFQKGFQTYIRNPEGKKGPPHAWVGAVYAKELAGGMLSGTIAGHHAGLPDWDTVKKLHFDKTRDNIFEEVKNIAASMFKGLSPTEANKKQIIAKLTPMVKTKEEAEVYLRMLFSTLVDADFLDTENYFSPEKTELRQQSHKLALLWEKFIDDQERLSGHSESMLNQSRNEIFQACLEAAENQPGFYRLTVPTGGGKTRSGMGFALKHAMIHNLDRIIVAIPYTSIVEQTVDVYRKIFGEDAVLEHHSAVEPHLGNEAEEEKHQLATENWDSPLIVTTTVQLFESLFANKTSRCRKIHNIARSIIILDEAQTLPTHLLDPILDMLRILVKHYGVTVVFCTATQPALTENQDLQKINGITEIVPQPERYFQRLKRVDYQRSDEAWSWAQVAEAMRSHEQCLVVVNTKKDALALLQELDDERAMHLSTLLCGAHRRQVLAEVKRRLKAGEDCRLVSTQVIEAGVDVDFPVVMRAIGPLDRIVQAAGRCNREGRLKDEAGRPCLGQVIIFDPSEGSAPPGTYLSAMQQSRMMLANPSIDLHDPAVYEKFFQGLYQNVETDAKGIQSLRQNFRYPEVAEKFRMIDQSVVPVIISYDEEARCLIDTIRRSGVLTRRIIRQLQPYIVNVAKFNEKQWVREGLMEPLAGDMFEWLGGYHPVMGLETKGRDPETLIF